MPRIEITEAELLADFDDALGIETEAGHTMMELCDLTGWGVKKVTAIVRKLLRGGTWEHITVRRTKINGQEAQFDAYRRVAPSG